MGSRSTKSSYSSLQVDLCFEGMGFAQTAMVPIVVRGSQKVDARRRLSRAVEKLNSEAPSVVLCMTRAFGLIRRSQTAQGPMNTPGPRIGMGRRLAGSGCSSLRGLLGRWDFRSLHHARNCRQWKLDGDLGGLNKRCRCRRGFGDAALAALM